MEKLSGIYLVLMESGVKASGSTDWADIFNALSANDRCFNSPMVRNDIAVFTSSQSHVFMPFSQAVVPAVWKVIATWLAANTQRSLRLIIGESVLEANSLVEIIELLNRALLIYDLNQEFNADGV
ncbi:hypothetical protein [Pseudomonas sichuanensis]|uniref:hypothetical protein n=1 Tax=Pseudomonas sichuanensis TaxID=2213015 RepID=UPI002ACB114F|nr:hypothetical protein [Pseudomonas sichuanensis]